MRSAAAATALLATAALTSAAPIASTATVSTNLAGTETIFALGVNDAEGITIPSDGTGIYTVTLDSDPWVVANKDFTRSIRCKVSTNSVRYDSTVSGTYVRATQFAEYIPAKDGAAHSLDFGVRFPNGYSGSEKLNLICKLKTPAAALDAVPNTSVNIGSSTEGEETSTTLPQIYSAGALPDRSHYVAARVEFTTPGPMSKKIIDGVKKAILLIEHAEVPTKYIFTGVSYNNVATTVVPVDAETNVYTTNMWIRAAVSPDVENTAGAAGLLTNEKLKETFVNLGADEASFSVPTAAAAFTFNGDCFDLVKNGAETDTDVGGADCAAAALKDTCKADTDCWSGVCDKLEAADVEGQCGNSASALTVSFAIVASFVAAALFGL